ncbi:DUF572-domain-containing protein [Xylariaceae sp. FL1272]|nr:DUF572-domain-containing protein [Xylariaceae sp. FL1272]
MQGFNMGRYVPPEHEGVLSANAASNKGHALGARARKLKTEGILTVRFEMPFAVWCSTCPKPTIIGQGVRFNAEKKKVGNYYSTPIWSFRIRHTECGGALEIRTDPQNAEYVVHEGGKRRDTGDEKDDSLVTTAGLMGVGEFVPGEREERRKDAFAHLEKTIEDRGVLIERSHRIAELEDVSARAWDDPYALNRRLRATFREGRKEREKEAKGTEELRDRMSLGIELLPGTEEDVRRAKLVDFGVDAALKGLGGGDGKRDKALVKPLFSSSTSLSTAESNTKNDKTPQKKRLKSEVKASQTRASLASEIVGNTRASHDPFIASFGGNAASSNGISLARSLQGIKRKRTGDQASPGMKHKQESGKGEDNVGNAPTSTGETETATTALVEYDSD